MLPNRQLHTPQILLLCTLLLLLTACGTLSAGNQKPAVPDPTNLPTSTPRPTDTPVPTNTPTPDRTATLAAAGTATATAVYERIQDDLTTYKIQPGEGHLLWASDDTFTLKADSHLEANSVEIPKLGDVSDFILQSDVIWDSSSGLAGCGFILRSDADLNNGKQYRLLIIRLQSMPIWDLSTYENNQYVTVLNPDNFLSRDIRDKPNSKNRLAVVARGKEMTVYINGIKLGMVESNMRDNGLLAFLVYQESGTTTCKFTNSWVWDLK